MKKLQKVPARIIWFLPMISIDLELKEFYFGFLKFAYVFEYGKL